MTHPNGSLHASDSDHEDLDSENLAQELSLIHEYTRSSLGLAFGESDLDNGVVLNFDNSPPLKQCSPYPVSVIEINENGVQDMQKTFDMYIKNIISRDNLVSLQKPDKKVSLFRNHGKVIVTKPREKAKGRLEFKVNTSEFYSNNEITIFMRGYDKSQEISCDFQPKPCACDNTHGNSVFCVVTRDRNENPVTWNLDGNPTARVTLSNNDDNIIYFASLFNQTKWKKEVSIIELVFQIEREFDILEQTYFIKVCASPSRDFKSFVEILSDRELIQTPKANTCEPSTSSGEEITSVWKIAIDPNDYPEIEKKIKNWNGAIYPWI